MSVKRIVTNIATTDTQLAKSFYGELLGLEVVMDMGWIATYSSGETMSTQISFASEGGSGTLVPELSIDVDNVDEIYSRAKTLGFEIVYDLIEEPWGVKRFYVRDPFGKVVNILQHSD